MDSDGHQLQAALSAVHGVASDEVTARERCLQLWFKELAASVRSAVIASRAAAARRFGVHRCVSAS